MRARGQVDRGPGRTGRDVVPVGGQWRDHHGRRADRGGSRTAPAGPPAVAQVEDPGLGTGDQRLEPRQGEQDEQPRDPAQKHIAQPVRTEVDGGHPDAERGHGGHGGQPAARSRSGGHIGQDSPGHHGVGGVTARKYIAAAPHLVRADHGRVVRSQPAHAVLGGADRDVQQEQRDAEGEQRTQGVLPPGAPAQPGRDHHRGRAALAEHHVVVDEPVDLRPLLVRPEEHDLPVEPDQPGRDHHSPHDRAVERRGGGDEHDAVPAHLRHIDVGGSFRLTIQPGEHPVQTGELRFGTHPIDVTASEL